MRNQDIEAILAAWYRREKCPINERAQAELSLNRLLDEARQNTPITREELKEWLYGHYKEYKRTRAANEKLEDRHAPQ